MQKLADINSLQEFLSSVEDRLELKAPAGHQHSAINGVTVLLSDTAPTDNDANVVTLLVETSALPTITEQHTEDIEKRLGYLLLMELVQGTVTARVFVNGTEDTSALVQFGYQGSSTYTVYRDWSVDKVYRGALGSINRVKVRVAGVEKAFTYTMGSTGEEYGPVFGGGFFVGGVSARPKNTDSNITYRYVYRTGTTGSDFRSFNFYRVTDIGSSSITDVDSFLELLTLSNSNIGAVTIGSSYAEVQINSLTSSDTQFSILAEATGSDGFKYYLLDSTSID